MAKLYAGINTERDTQVTRIGHRELQTFIQTNDNRISVYATPESFKILVEDGRYRNIIGKTGMLAEVKNGYIYISSELADKIIIR